MALVGLALLLEPLHDAVALSLFSADLLDVRDHGEELFLDFGVDVVVLHGEEGGLEEGLELSFEAKRLLAEGLALDFELLHFGVLEVLLHLEDLGVALAEGVLKLVQLLFERGDDVGFGDLALVLGFDGADLVEFLEEAVVASAAILYEREFKPPVSGCECGAWCFRPGGN